MWLIEEDDIPKGTERRDSRRDEKPEDGKDTEADPKRFEEAKT